MKAFKSICCRFLAGLTVCGACGGAFADLLANWEEVYQASATPEGFFVLAEDRFDPWVQRMMAERSLKSLPLYKGRLYYLYPIDIDPDIGEMQIRYMEELLEKQEQE